MVGQRVGRVPPVEAIELVAAGDHVVMSVRGVGIGPPVEGDEDEARGQATIVYTLVDGKSCGCTITSTGRSARGRRCRSVAWD